MTQTEDTPRLKNRKQARTFLNISDRTLSSLVAAGELKPTYIGRRTLFHPETLERFAKKGTSAEYQKR